MPVKRFELQVEAASEFLKSLANPVRLRILCALAAEESSVSALSRLTAAPMATVSRHLALLRREGIIASRRSRQTIFYRLADPAVNGLIEVLAQSFCPAPLPPQPHPESMNGE